jgi:[protein-PII] uridylyltransferase
MSDRELNLDRIAARDTLREKLDAIAHRHGDCAQTTARNEVLAQLKQCLDEGEAQAEKMLFDDGKGLHCAKRLAHLHDTVICALFDFTKTHVFKAANPSKGERLAVVAIGGYGRRTMAPGSDVDILFLLPYKQTPLGEQIAEYMLYMLWDLQLKVGHATRNVDECIRLSRNDMTICTSILEARYLAGDRDLFNELEERYGDEVIDRISSDFIREKLAERDNRHRRMGESRYVLEPNVKDGKGGLRDLHTLFWIAKFFYRVRKRADLATKGVFTRRDYNLFIKCEDFLWAVRCHLHFATGKAEERLSFEMQRDIAARLGYQSHAGLRDVERFMKHYFLIAKDVGDLTRIFCASLEEQDLKQAPGLNTLFKAMLPTRRVRKIRGNSDFVIDNHRINVAEHDVFERDPVNLIRMFDIADRHGLEYHPDMLRRVRTSLKYIKAPVRNDPEANRCFINVLTSHHDPELNLRRMNEAGVLGKFITEFGRIVAMMQFNMYHHFTVDEHLIRTVGVLSKIEDGRFAEDHPLAARLLPTLSGSDRTILYVSLLLHDIAKGRPEDHSIAGAEVARKLCPRFGMSKDETRTVAWLIEEHLTMSTVAQSRDLSDRKTIEDFANRVQTLRRLKLLVILTVCDIRAVGPGVWNGWKGQLLRTLYAEAELALTGGYSEANRDARVEGARKALGEALHEWPEDDIENYTDLHYGAYLLTVDIAEQVRHTTMLRDLDRSDESLLVDVKTDAFKAITEITVITPDHPRLLAIIAAACASASAKIDNAQAFTTKDGRAIDTILINRAFESADDELRRGKRIAAMIGDVLAGKQRQADVVASKDRPKKSLKAFHVEPFVRLNNNLSNRHSVIQIEALDRPGLLFDITTALSDLALDIRSAHVTTFGEKAVDSFYVTDLVGQKVVSRTREKRIVSRMTEVLDPAYPKAVRTGKTVERPAAKRKISGTV